MDFLETLAASLPEDFALVDLLPLQPDRLWQTAPRMAAANALALSGRFDAESYLDCYPDVAADGIDPTLHFVCNGLGEHRKFNAPLKLNPWLEGLPKVSVLVPIFNNAQYLPECIASIVNQTLTRIEIILINDGSTDPSVLPLLKEYADSDRRIRLINKQNTGYGHSMNVGLEAARGKYIGIVESDDYVDLNMYETLYSIAEEHNTDFVKCNFTKFVGSGEKRKHDFCAVMDKKWANRVLDETVEPLEYNRKGFMAIWAALYSKSFLQRYAIKFTQTPGASYQDTSFWLNTLALAKRIYFHPECLHHYRCDNEASSVKNMNRIFPICYELMQYKKTLYKYGLRKRFDSLYQKQFVDTYCWALEKIILPLKMQFQDRFRTDLMELNLGGFLNRSSFSQSKNVLIDNICSSGKTKIACIYTASIDKGGGLDRAASELSIILKNNGYSVFIILTFPQCVGYDFYGEIIPANINDNRLRKVIDSADVIFDLKFKDTMTYDNIVKYCVENYAYKYVSAIHASDERIHYFFKTINTILKGDISRLKAITCVSQKVKNDFIALYGNAPNIRLIYNSLDLAEMDRTNSLAKNPGIGPYILLGARLSATEVKGLDILVPAFLKSDASKSVSLVLAGAEELDSRLKFLIASHPRGHMIKMPGFQDLLTGGWLKYAHFLISPSRREGFSLMIIEALASGIPVLATRAGGSEEIIIQGQNGMFIENLTPDALAKDIDQMLSMCDQMRQNCRNSVKHLDRENIGRQLMEVIEAR